MAQGNLTQRADAFWQWFTENEAQLAGYADNSDEYDSEQINAFMNEGLDLLADKMYYNMGGGSEFNFAAEGDVLHFFPYDYIVSHMPEPLCSKRNRSNCTTGAAAAS